MEYGLAAATDAAGPIIDTALGIVATGIPGAGLIGVPLKALAGHVLKKKAESGESKQRNLVVLRSNIVNNLNKRDKNVLVIIDDMDRLSSEEIRLIFKLVTLTASFPRIVYMLAFDREVVCKALEQVQHGSGGAYLEKIIQLHVNLHPVPPDKIVSMAEKMTASAYDVSSFEYKRAREQNRAVGIVNDLVARCVDTPRKLCLLQNEMTLEVIMTHDQVVPLDLIGMCTVKLFLPRTYDTIVTSRFDLCTDGYLRSPAPMLDRPKTKEICAKVVKALRSDGRPGAFHGVQALFPTLKDEDRPSMFQIPQAPREEGRICSIDLLESFMGRDYETPLSANEIDYLLHGASEKEAVSILEKASARNGYIGALKKIESEIDELDRGRAKVIARVLVLTYGQSNENEQGLLMPMSSDGWRDHILHHLAEAYEIGFTSQVFSSLSGKLAERSLRAMTLTLLEEFSDSETRSPRLLDDESLATVGRRYIEWVRKNITEILFQNEIRPLLCWQRLDTVCKTGSYKLFEKRVPKDAAANVLVTSVELVSSSTGSFRINDDLILERVNLLTSNDARPVYEEAKRRQSPEELLRRIAALGVIVSDSRGLKDAVATPRANRRDYLAVEQGQLHGPLQHQMRPDRSVPLPSSRPTTSRRARPYPSLAFLALGARLQDDDIDRLPSRPINPAQTYHIDHARTPSISGTSRSLRTSCSRNPRNEPAQKHCRL